MNSIFTKKKSHNYHEESHICPECGCRTFVVPMTLRANWYVDSEGDCVGPAEIRCEPVDGPDEEVAWVCANCGADAVTVGEQLEDKRRLDFDNLLIRCKCEQDLYYKGQNIGRTCSIHMWHSNEDPVLDDCTDVVACTVYCKGFQIDYKMECNYDQYAYDFASDTLPEIVRDLFGISWLDVGFSWKVENL